MYSDAASESYKQHELNHSSGFTVLCKEWNPVFDWLVRSLELGSASPHVRLRTCSQFVEWVRAILAVS